MTRACSLVACLLLMASASAFVSPRAAAFPPRVAARRAAAAVSMEHETGVTCTGEKVVIVGATGYIGKAVVRESVRRGYPTTAVVRDPSKVSGEAKFSGASVVAAEVTEPASLAASPAFAKGEVDVVISCLASRSGMKKDAYMIDYQATLNAMNAAKEAGARHFVLLSAFCVAKPWLQFQFAKLDFEEKLTSQSDLTYSIVRPTAFFKSLSGQVEVVQGGAPFVYFDLGGGRSATCNPISEADLAVAIIDTISDKSRENSIWNIGGQDDPLSMVNQGELLADVLKKEPNLLGVPIGLFDAIINSLQYVADVLKKNPHPIMKEWYEKMNDAAEFGRIGKYYAVEDMLTTDPSEKFGQITLREHYSKVAVEGQEYDPYTSMFAKKK